MHVKRGHFAPVASDRSRVGAAPSRQQAISAEHRPSSGHEPPPSGRRGASAAGHCSEMMMIGAGSGGTVQTTESCRPVEWAGSGRRGTALILWRLSAQDRHAEGARTDQGWGEVETVVGTPK